MRVLRMTRYLLKNGKQMDPAGSNNKMKNWGYGWPDHMYANSFKNYKEKGLANWQSYH